jgi:4-hydroxy-tetrahydrodipicolinate synthase
MIATTPDGSTSPSPSSHGTMRAAAERFGLGVALVTPFEADGGVDTARLVAHARRCLERGCRTVTLFGTTGEGASLGLGDRSRMLDAMIAANFDFGGTVLGGVAASAPADAAAQANQILAAGARGLLLTPPFYFKGVTDEGLYAWFARVLDACRDPRGVILYHLPSVTGVALSLPLVERLRRAYPGVVCGVKDSGGDWDYTRALLAAQPDLHILVGDERFRARAVREGGSGAINSFAHFCAPLLLPMVARGEEVPAVNALVDLLLAHPVTPALKALVAHVTGDPAYARVAPPLAPLPAAATAELVAAYGRLPQLPPAE